MLTELSLKIGGHIAKKSDNPEQAEVIAYGTELLLGAVIKGLIISLVTWFIGTLYESWMVLLFSALLRTFSGGVHCTSYTRCLITSSLVFSSLGVVVKLLQPHLTEQALFAIVTLATLILWAICIIWIPTGNEVRPLTKYNDKVKFKILSFVIISLYFSVFIVALNYFSTTPKTFLLASITGLLWQGFTVTPFGFSFVGKYDNLLKTFSKDNSW
jgi:accessory gene regulator B